MATIRFNVKPTANNKMQIRAIFQDGEKQIPKNIGESIPANKIKTEYKYWDKKKQEVKLLDGAERINSTISKWKSAFDSYKDDCKRELKKVDINSFILSMEGKVYINNSSAPTLLSIITSFLAFIKPTYNPRTYGSYKVIEQDIIEYETTTKRQVLLSEIDRAFYMELSTFLIKHENNINTTINKKQGRIITIITHEIDRLKIKLTSLDYKKKYILKEIEAPKFPLRSDELATLRAYASESNFLQYKNDLKTAIAEYNAIKGSAGKRKKEIARGKIKTAKTTVYHRMVLDAFLLACDTGLRHSDIVQLQAAHIQSHVTATGIIKFIDLTNIKTDGANNMPLSERAIKIIDNYTNADTTYIFQFNHSQTAGKVLKEIFKKDDVKLNRPCEIVYKKGAKTIRTIKPLDQVISFHMGRNTYITRLLVSNVAPAFVQENAGHANIKTTMGYYRDNEVLRWEETLTVLNKKDKPA